MRRKISFLILLLAMASANPLHAGGTGWESVFNAADGPLTHGFREPVATGMNGSVFVAADHHEPGPSVVARIDPATGSALWTASAKAQFAQGSPILPLADGSSIVISGALTRLDPDGAHVWSVPNQTPMGQGHAALMPGGTFVVAAPAPGSTRFVEYDTANGQVLFVVASEQSVHNCQVFHLIASANAVYAVTACADRALIKVARNPLRIDWILPASLANGLSLGLDSLVSVDGEGLYITAKRESQTAVARLSVSDGSVVWEQPAPGNAKQLVADDAGGVLVSRTLVGVPVIDRLDSADGSILWSHSDSGSINSVIVSPIDVIAVGTDVAESGQTTGFIARLNLDSGAQSWRRAALPSIPGSSQLASAAISDGAVITVGAEGEIARPLSWRLRIWRTSLNGVSAVESSPLHGRASTSGVVREDIGDHTLAAVINFSAEGPQLHMRRLRNGDGAVVWESVIPVAPDHIWIPQVLDVLRSGDGNIVVGIGIQGGTTGTGTGTGTAQASSIEIVKIDVVSRQVAWSRALTGHPVFNVQSSAMRSDPAGHVFIGVHESLHPNSGLPAQRRSVLKLDAASGTPLWRSEFPLCSLCEPLFSPPLTTAVGDDVLVHETPMHFPTFPWTRLVGATGNVAWASPPHTGQPTLLGSTSALHWKSVDSAVLLDRIDLATGAVEWSTQYADPADTRYAIARTRFGSDGAIYAAGSRYSGTASQGIVLRFNATTGALEWVQRMDANPVSTASGSAHLIAQADGSVYIGQNFNHLVTGSFAHFLTRLDAASGAIAGTRFVFRYDENQPQRIAEPYTISLGMTQSGQLLTSTTRMAPASPGLLVIVAHSAPALSENGALSVTLDIDHAQPDSSTAFVFNTRNDGTVTAVGAEALLDIPPGALPDDISCSIEGSACEAVVTPTSVSATSDLAPGAELTISGILRAIPGDQPTKPLFASTYAPYGFGEANMNDNRASALPWDELFADGFE